MEDHDKRDETFIEIFNILFDLKDTKLGYFLSRSQIKCYIYPLNPYLTSHTSFIYCTESAYKIFYSHSNNVLFPDLQHRIRKYMRFFFSTRVSTINLCIITVQVHLIIFGSNKQGRMHHMFNEKVRIMLCN